MLSRAFGIVGGALAWSIRAVVDSVFQFWLARRVANVKLDLGDIGPKAVFAIAIFCPTIVLTVALPEQKLVAAILFCIGLAGYALFCWRIVFSGPEREWLQAKLKARFA